MKYSWKVWCNDLICPVLLLARRWVLQRRWYFFPKMSHPIWQESSAMRVVLLKRRTWGNIWMSPSCTSGLINKTYAYIIESMHQKLASWKSKNLSLAGRITLCKTVLAAVPLYPMQSSLILKSLCIDIERIRKDFMGKMNIEKDLTLLNGKQYVTLY